MCQCTSCSYTDSFHAKGFAEWPRGNPAGRKAASEYAAHASFSLKWGNIAADGSKRGKAEFPRSWFAPGAKPVYRPLPAVMEGGADRSYPTHADVVLGTAHYVAAFLSANGYAKEKASPAEAEPASPAEPAKALQHFPGANRHAEADEDSSEGARIYDMPKSTSEKRPIGRPALPGSRVVIKLPDELRKRAEKLGNGNIAAGIREALKRSKVG